MTEESLFAEAIAISDPMARAAFLERACQGNADLRCGVEALLAAHAASNPLDRPAVVDVKLTHSYAPPSEKPGTIIAGRYKLLEEIGVGGMGTVWVAEQLEPVKRKVAVKLIKPGMDSRTVLARFEAERQALALMDHPNIAKVHDGGLTDSGRPFFVMEYVKGIPITEYCDTMRLRVEERLQLFIQVCHAVQHAHQKGVIHRDLKPSNILVAPYDGTPVPKVIDFGLAKAMHQPLTDKTLHTAHETVLGTPLYMSPEQAQLNNLDVDTRSDIYSLGVLLYELLTGTTPLDRQRFKEAAWDEIRRLIREEEPPRPSARLSSTATLPFLAASRQTEPVKLTKLLRGELDWIVMKALEKDRSRRYDSANDFAADIGRHLASDPVQAAPPSASYRLRKFIKRNHARVAAAAAVLAVLLAGAAVSVYLAVAATRAERKAQQEAALAKAVSEFLQKDLLEQADLDSGPQRDLKLRTVLDRASERMDGKFTDQPLVEASLRRTLGKAYGSLGEYGTAEKHFRRALEIYTPLLGDKHTDTLDVLTCLGLTCMSLAKLEEAEQLLARAWEIATKAHGPNAYWTLTAREYLADVQVRRGNYSAARRAYDETLAVFRKLHGDENLVTVSVMERSAWLHLEEGEPEAAEKLGREVLAATQKHFGVDHSRSLSAQALLARVQLQQGREAEAEKQYHVILDKARRLVDERHPLVLKTLESLGILYLKQGKNAEAEKLLQTVLDGRLATYGPLHLSTWTAQANLAEVFSNQGRAAAAEKLHREVLEQRRAALGIEHPHTLLSEHHLAVLAFLHGQLSDAETRGRKIWETRQRVLGGKHPDTLKSGHVLAKALIEQGRDAEAEPLLVATLKSYEDLGWKGKHPEYADAQSSFGSVLMKKERWTEAETMFRESLAINDKLRAESWVRFNTQSRLGAALAAQEKFAEAEPFLLSGYEGLAGCNPSIPCKSRQIGRIRSSQGQ